MPYCKLHFYSDEAFEESKNFIIEDLPTYLSKISALKKRTLNNYQYIKPQLNQTIKITGLLVNAENYINDINDTPLFSRYYSNMNYLEVEYGSLVENVWVNSSQSNQYYFIKSWNWKAQDTAEIELKMDVLNTLGVPSGSSNVCDWNKKTLITRQHQNRYALDAESNPCWVIDKKSEGITAYQYKTRDQLVIEAAQHYMKWYFLWRNTTDDPLDSSSLIDLYLVPEWDIVFTAGSNPAMTVNGIDKWNLKTPAIIKVVELPYCPTDKFINDGNDAWHIAAADFTNNFTTSGGNWIKSTNSHFKYSNEFSPYLDDTTFDHINPMYNDEVSDLISEFTDDPTMAKKQKYEPKLYHSDFYSVKYLYDTIAKNVKFEEFDFTEDDNFAIKFCPSKACSSKSLFKIDAEQWVNGKEDFYKYLASNRSNDYPLEVYQYYTYLLSQEGWDQFKMDLQSGKQAMGIVGKFLSGSKVADWLSGISDIGNMILDRTGNEASMEQTKSILQNQAASVAGSDDLDLFNEYSGNKLHKIRYEVSKEMKQMLFDLFYYTGYIQNKMGKPDTSSRYWFNYVQCVPVLDKKTLAIAPNVWEEYENKWKEGITIFHKNIIDDTAKWGISQEYENIENGLL